MAKYLDLAGLTAYDGKLKEWIKSGLVDITDDSIRVLFVKGQPNNEIWYTSTDGNVVNPGNTSGFGANVVSNTYENGKGIITFDSEVSSIGDYAFYNRSSLTSITIPNSVTSIGDNAFNGTGIYNNNSNWENDVLYIDDCLIEAKSSISGTYTIKENTRLIADGAFRGCSSLTSITIPESVTNIGSSAFSGCSSLTSVTIPNSVTSIGDYAFNSCTSLTSVTIPESVTSIGWQAFYGCSSLPSVTIPNSVTSIGNYAFQDCSSLTSVTIGNSVTSIGEKAFEDCSALTSVTIPNSVTSIGIGAFSGTGIYNDESNWENDVLYIDDCLIEAKSSISGTYTIKENTRLIAGEAFWGCSLTAVTIPNSVTSIGIGAFSNSSYLTSITIPDSVTSIGNGAFSSCYYLTSITIPNSVTSIGDWAFKYCRKLSSITFEGTIEEWNNITKGIDWKYDVPATHVQCTDGQVRP